MEKVKIYFLTYFICLSTALSAQSIKPKDLIGFWEGRGALTRYEFVNDSVGYMHGGIEGNTFKYVLSNENGHNKLTTLTMDEGDSLYLFYEVTKIDSDTMKFENIKFRWFHSRKKTWEEIDNKRYTIIFTRVVRLDYPYRSK